jgi:hypothetical protein
VIAFGLTLSLLAHASSAVAPAQDIRPLPTLQVAAPNDIASIQSLTGALDTLSEKVTACVKGGDSAEMCQCRYPQDLVLLRKRYEGVIAKHPDWKDQLLSYQYVNKEGRNISGTLAMSTLRRELDVLKCE